MGPPIFAYRLIVPCPTNLHFSTPHRSSLHTHMPHLSQLPNDELPSAFRGRTHIDPSTINITGVAGTVDVTVNTKSVDFVAGDEYPVQTLEGLEDDLGDGDNGDDGGSNDTGKGREDTGTALAQGDIASDARDGEASDGKAPASADEESSEVKSWVLDYVGREEAARKSHEEAQLWHCNFTYTKLFERH